MMAMRALKRRLSNVVFARMLEDQKRREETGPGGQSGTTLHSSATDLTPDIGSSKKPRGLCESLLEEVQADGSPE